MIALFSINNNNNNNNQSKTIYIVHSTDGAKVKDVDFCCMLDLFKEVSKQLSMVLFTSIRCIHRLQTTTDLTRLKKIQSNLENL